MNEIRYKLNGKEVSAEEFSKNSAGIGLGADIPANTQGWPYFSSAAKVHPRQIKKAIEDAKRRGVRIEFDDKGRPKFESARHQTEYLKVRGLFNMDGGYAETINKPFRWEDGEVRADGE